MSDNDLPKDEARSDPSIESDEDRAELAWLLVRDADPNAAPPSAEIASQHAALEHLLRSLPPEAQDESWHAEVMKQITALPPARRPGRRQHFVAWTLAGGGLLAAAAILVLVLLPKPPALVVQIGSSGPMRGNTPSNDRVHYDLQNHLVAQLPPGNDNDLRVYGPSGTLLARCPNGPACVTSSTGAHIDLLALEPGWYQVTLVTGTSQIPIEEAKDAFANRADEDHTARFEFR